MRIFNQKTQKIEKFEPIEPNKLKIYVCGPTIYDHIHIGNARPIIFFDVVHRVFKALDYEVEFTSNITDVDDKIIKKSLVENITEEELVDKYFIEFKNVVKSLNVLPYSHQPRVTQYMQEIISYIEKLVDLGFAYVVEGDVYFSVDKIDSYGEISNINLENAKNAVRIEVNKKKLNENDFTLWKKTDVGIKWESKFSTGRPGWHTECVAMIESIYDSTIDIHGGGIDLKFPHHENENAQSKACGKKLANYWMHNGFINIDNTKMSKSLGNVTNTNEFVQEYGANVLRLTMLQTNYRQPINITKEFVQQNIKINERFSKVYAKIRVENISEHENEHVKVILDFLKEDFSTANVISYLLGLTKIELSTEVQIGFIYAFNILGLEYEQKEFVIPNEIQVLINARTKAKQAKNFELADNIRKEIEAHGFEILDTRNGVECKKR